MPLVAEGQDAPKREPFITKPSHLQGGVLVNFKNKVTADLRNIRRRIHTRLGWVQVAEGRVGMLKRRCEHSTPCGWRAFPGAEKPSDITWGDCRKLLLRAGWTDEQLQTLGEAIYKVKVENDRYRRAGLLRKGDAMFLGRVPGPLVRGLCHDFPDEFSTAIGGTVDVQHRWLERVLTDFFVNRCYRAAGATA